MADTDMDTSTDEATTVVKTITVPVTKAKSSVEIAIGDIPDDVYMEALALGLKELVNRGMSKETKAAHKGDEAKLADACMAIATKNVAKIKASEIKFAGKKAAKSGHSQAVVTEAMRLAKALVKDGIKAAGMKISLVKASVITEAAKAYLAQDPSLYTQAEANLEERSKTPLKIDIKALVKEDAGLAAKAAKEKAEKPISKTQAGKVKGRQNKGQTSSQAAH